MAPNGSRCLRRDDEVAGVAAEHLVGAVAGRVLAGPVELDDPSLAVVDADERPRRLDERRREVALGPEQGAGLVVRERLADELGELGDALLRPAGSGSREVVDAVTAPQSSPWRKIGAATVERIPSSRSHSASAPGIAS